MEIQLNKDLIKRVNDQSMFDRGNHIQSIANNLYQEFIDNFKNDNYNKSQNEVFEKRKEVFKDFLEKSYNEYLNIDSSFVPINVAGPSNYPHSKMDKIMNRIVNKEKEISEKVDKFYQNTEKMLKEQLPLEEMIQKYRNGFNDSISSDDPNAKDKLQAKLEYLEEKHLSYKNYNKKARANGEKQLDSYVLSNSNQNIKSVKDRLRQIEKTSNVNLSNYYFKNGEVHFDKNDNRIKLFFDNIPIEETRTELKRNGFKWSPKNKAWQRMLTPQAINVTKRLFKDVESIEVKQVHDYTDNKEVVL